MRNKLQKKASSKNQKDFWSVINEINGKKMQADSLKLDINGEITSDPEKISEIMASFFSDKISTLCQKTGLEIPIKIPVRTPVTHTFTHDDLNRF